MSGEAIEIIEQEILDQNKGFDRIEYDMRLIRDVDGYPFVVEWRTDDSCNFFCSSSKYSGSRSLTEVSYSAVRGCPPRDQRSVWQGVHYQKRCEKGGAKRYAYEEMILTIYEMDTNSDSHVMFYLIAFTRQHCCQLHQHRCSQSVLYQMPYNQVDRNAYGSGSRSVSLVANDGEGIYHIPITVSERYYSQEELTQMSGAQSLSPYRPLSTE